VYEGSNAINYVYLRSVGIMLGQNLVRDYTDSAIVELGKRLVDPSDSSWNLLLAELSKLSQIVEESTNDRDHESSGTAAPELRER